MDENILFQTINVSKSFGPVRALNNIKLLSKGNYDLTRLKISTKTDSVSVFFKEKK
jgi:hypothetical protein